VTAPSPRIGTSGWGNPPTERPRRATGETHLAHYAELFNAVEINSSFYRPHRRETYRRWAAATPPGFRFSVKCPRSITHEAALSHCGRELGEFLEQASGLGRKLAVILVQLPASASFDRTLTRRFFGSLASRCSAGLACEARNAEWFSAAANETLARLGVARVAADPPRAPGADQPGGARELIYYRLHGSPKIYHSAYSDPFLAALANELRHARSRSRAVWCVFDNTARYGAWGNARRLRALLESQIGRDSAGG
jgi:uncharacterized protein YecE (DUF72 family)